MESLYNSNARGKRKALSEDSLDDSMLSTQRISRAKTASNEEEEEISTMVSSLQRENLQMLAVV